MPSGSELRAGSRLPAVPLEAPSRSSSVAFLFPPSRSCETTPYSDPLSAGPVNTVPLTVMLSRKTNPGFSATSVPSSNTISSSLMVSGPDGLNAAVNPVAGVEAIKDLGSSVVDRVTS